MSRFIFSFIVLGAAICQAAMVEYEKLPEELEESVVYYSTFNDELPDLDDIGLRLAVSEDSTACVGDAKGYRLCWVDGLERRDVMRGNEFTVSFDLHAIQGRKGSVLLSLYTKGYAWNSGLLLRIGKKNTLELICSKFGNASNSERNARITLGRIDELVAEHKTITLVYRGKENQVCTYVDGEPSKKSIRLKYHDKPASKQLASLQFGSQYGGGGEMSRAEIDNLCIWNKALDDEQVDSIVQGKVSPVVWQVLAAVGGVLVFALQALLFYMAGRRSALRKTQPRVE